MYDKFLSVYEQLKPPSSMVDLFNSTIKDDDYKKFVDSFEPKDFKQDSEYDLSGYDLTPPIIRDYDLSEYDLDLPTKRKYIKYKADKQYVSYKGQDVVDIARLFLNTPYNWGGTDPETGFDCSGLIQYVYKQVGVDIPRTSHEMGKIGTEVELSNVQPGDIIYTSSSGPSKGHVKMVSNVKNGQIYTIEAKGKDEGIQETLLTNTSNIKSIRRILNSTFNSNGEFVYMMDKAYRSALRNRGIDEDFATMLVAQDVQESGWGKKPVGNYNYGNIVISNKNQSYTKGSDGNNYRNFDSLEDYINCKIDLLNKSRYNFFNIFNSNSDVKIAMQVLADKGYAVGNKTYGIDVQNVYQSIQKYL